MKLQILSTIDLSYCKKELNKIKTFAKYNYHIGSVSSLKKKIKKTNIYISNAGYVVDSNLLSDADNLKEIYSPSTGTDHIDINYLSKKGVKLYHIAKKIRVLNNFSATSELVFGLIFLINRKLIDAYEAAKKGYWPREKYIGNQLKDKTFGILGYGRLGAISAKIARGFGMKVIAHDIKKKFNKSISFVSMNRLFSESDYLSVHIHLNKKTENLITNKFLKLMKKNSILINTSRGKIINEKDLLDVLKRKKIAGAALDVIDGEWLNQTQLKNHKLIKHMNKNDNLVIVPHIGGTTVESIAGSRKYICDLLIKNLKKYKK
tara:strand:- start:35505 stop:36461 length:957 start_codon:yes stop_codon:yes gene_type:complete